MNTELARTFLVVIATGSFVEASQRLHVTQSTVSTRIQGLEEALGAEPLAALARHAPSCPQSFSRSCMKQGEEANRRAWLASLIREFHLRGCANAAQT